MGRRELTPRQRAILEHIRQVMRRTGEAPSYRQIGRRFRIASTNGVRDHLKALERKGCLRIAGRRRGIVLPEVGGELPVLGTVPAGAPVLSEEHVEERLRLPQEFGPDAFGLRVRGDSMTGAGILDGDIVVVRPCAEPRTGQIVVAVLDGEATVKRIELGPRGIVLHAENRRYPPIEVDRPDAIRIVGRVVGLIRRMG